MALNDCIRQIDEIGRTLQTRVREWAVSENFAFQPAGKSDYWCAKRRDRMNWLQLNGKVHGQKSYGDWKLMARFKEGPRGALWEEVPPYRKGTVPFQWILGGDSGRWGVSYDRLMKELKARESDAIVEQILAEIRAHADR